MAGGRRGPRAEAAGSIELSCRAQLETPGPPGACDCEAKATANGEETRKWAQLSTKKQEIMSEKSEQLASIFVDPPPSSPGDIWDPQRLPSRPSAILDQVTFARCCCLLYTGAAVGEICRFRRLLPDLKFSAFLFSRWFAITHPCGELEDFGLFAWCSVQRDFSILVGSPSLHDDLALVPEGADG